MRYSKLFPVLACALSLAGCTRVLSLNQVAPEAPVALDPALAGVWTDSEGKSFCKIEADKTVYGITYSSDLTDAVKLQGRLLAAGDPMLLDLLSTADNPFAVNGHAVARLWLEGERLRWAFVDSEWLQDQLLRELPSTKAKDQLLILAPGDAVRKFMLARGSDPRANGEVQELHRVR